MKKIEIFVPIFLIFLLNSFAITQTPKLNPNNEYFLRNTKRINQIRKVLKREFENSPKRPDYPIQDFYHLPVEKSSDKLKSTLSDSTPPSTPSNLEVIKESIHSIFARWTASTDLESGIDYYAYAIGTQPGEADIRWWQSVGQNTNTYAASLAELGIPEDSTFYITVYAVNGAGLQSPAISSAPISSRWEDLGDPGNTLTIAFADFGYDSTGGNMVSGWDSTEIQTLHHFISRMNPIIKEIYGPPSHSYTVTLVKNLWYSGSNVFFPSSNEIHMSEMYPQLLTHELVHAYRDNVILSTDEFWRFHPKLSGFEESFAQGVSYACMNRYIELYPDDAIVDSTSLFGSSMDWDYDFRNVPAITTEDYWSDFGGMGLFWERYELGAAAMRKIHLEYENFFKKFNTEYYHRLNQDHSLTTSRDLMIDIIAKIVPEIEMQPAAEWIANQHIFDCIIKPGKKIWVRTQHYPWQEFIIFQRIFYYETFKNGSDWAYWDENSEQWIYYHLNGATGTGSVSTKTDSITWQGNLLIEPTDNPPIFYGFGCEQLNFSTAQDLQPWPGGDPTEFVLGMLDLNLYRINLNFDGATLQTFRVIGEELRSTSGVFGGFQNATEGVIYLDHENFPAEPPLPVTNGAFWGSRNWASVPNQKTGGTDSQPGKISIRFVQNDGRQYLAKRNIDWGSWNGNQAFLFNTEDMVLDTSVVSQVSIKNEHMEFKLGQNYPNPFNPTTEIQYILPLTVKVEIFIYNLLGQRIKTLVSKKQGAGNYTVRWDGTNNLGKSVGSGSYFCVLKAGDYREVKKMLLLH